MIKALEIIGNMLDEASNEAHQLPNEYTRGQLNGVTRVYQAIMREIENPPNRTPKNPNEEIPFSTPPVNPETGQMQKYSDQTVGMLQNIQHRNVTYTSNSDPKLNELIRIRQSLERLEGKLVPVSVPSIFLDNEAKDFDPSDQVVSEKRQAEIQEELIQQKAEDEGRTRRDILDDMTRESEEAGLYDDPAYPDTSKEKKEILAPEPSREKILNDIQKEEDPKQHRPWNQSFGKGLGGSDFRSEPTEETVFDPDTGEEGKVRTIGAKFNPDDDDEKTVEEWNNTDQQVQHRGIYYDKGNFNELEDLQPGE